jgi:hypothetical protein
LRRLDAGEPISDRSMGRIEATMLWVEGSCERILDGLQPIERDVTVAANSPFDNVAYEIGTAVKLLSEAPPARRAQMLSALKKFAEEDGAHPDESG